MILKPEGEFVAPTDEQVQAGLAALDGALAKAKEHLISLCVKDGRVDNNAANANQQALHGLAYLACEHAAAHELVEYAKRVGEATGRNDLETLIAQAYVAGCVRRWRFGADISGLEQIPSAEIGLTAEVQAATVAAPEQDDLIAKAGGSAILSKIAEVVHDRGSFGDFGIGDELLSDVQKQFQKFADNVVVPIAEHVHRKDELIPLSIIDQLAEQGVFGITIPEQYGGTELGKMGMVIVTEELSRGYIGVGSLGTRAEIAAELILTG
ncbi:acyl-CoA dehydrogenase family protein, partial [bacterium]|nr:acyl-CoA dehydrogenase family protein [bacterium]